MRRSEEHQPALFDRLEFEAERLRKKALAAGPGFKRDELLKKADELDMTARMTKWVTSRELKPPVG